jgi:hypothetical protein
VRCGGGCHGCLLQGILYEDTFLQIGLQCRYSGSRGDLLLFLGNKLAAQPVTGLQLALAAASSALQVEVGQLPAQLAPKQQVQVRLWRGGCGGGVSELIVTSGGYTAAFRQLHAQGGTVYHHLLLFVVCVVFVKCGVDVNVDVFLLFVLRVHSHNVLAAVCICSGQVRARPHTTASMW